MSINDAHCTCITIFIITILHIIFRSNIQHFNLYAVTKHLRRLWPQVTNDRKGDLKVCQAVSWSPKMPMPRLDTQEIPKGSDCGRLEPPFRRNQSLG